MNRRHFLKSSATLGGSLALPHSLMAEPTSKLIRGNAEHVISIWLGGGMAQTDTFDPKRVGDPKANERESLIKLALECRSPNHSRECSRTCSEKAEDHEQETRRCRRRPVRPDGRAGVCPEGRRRPLARPRACRASGQPQWRQHRTGLTVNNKWLPEVDISYFFTPNLAAELILTVPQKHTVYAGGTSIGSLKHLPPTLLLR